MYRLYIKKDISSKKMLDDILKENQIYNYEIIKNEYGKPYIKGLDIFISISHSKNVCAIALAYEEIGLDIMHFTYKNNLHHTFNEKELKLLDNALNKEEVFTKMWTMKEAYSKMIGMGLSYGLNNIDTTKVKGDFIYNEDYIICVVSKGM